MQTSAQHAERYPAAAYPEITQGRARTATALALRALPAPDLATRLHAATSRTDPHHVATTDDGDVHDPLSGKYAEPRLDG
jgi:hypothetical protein